MPTPALAPRAKQPHARYAVIAAVGAFPIALGIGLLLDNKDVVLPIFLGIAILSAVLTVVYFRQRPRAERGIFEAFAALHGFRFEPEGEPAGQAALGEEMLVITSCSGVAENGEQIVVVRAFDADNTPPAYTLVRFERTLRASDYPAIRCEARLDSEASDKVEERVAMHDLRHVYMESDAFNQRFELFAGPGQDPIAVKRLFSPSFVLWLTETAPPRFCFDVIGGVPTCYVRGHRTYGGGAVVDTVEQLEALVTASVGVGERLRNESVEAS